MSKITRTKISSGAPPAKLDFEIPSWAGFAPSGTHLDVMKGDKLIELQQLLSGFGSLKSTICAFYKSALNPTSFCAGLRSARYLGPIKLIIDEKKCYFFGRNSESCDFIIEHASCSRVHAALLYHKHLKRMFIVDLGSLHGSYIRNLRLEGKKPTPIPFDTNFRFGASTRSYILKERPQLPAQPAEAKAEEEMSFDLPQEEEELDNLTEFNTAHNKRVTSLPLEDITAKFPRRKRKSVAFAEDEEVINPEDIDSSVGRFRNMVAVQVIPNKRLRESTGLVSSTNEVKKHIQEFYNQGLYENLDEEDNVTKNNPVHSRISDFVPNLAPDVEENADVEIETSLVVQRPQVFPEAPVDMKPRKKYVKEAWPGKRPAPALLV